MPITIDGSGAVSGINAGGLPDGCVTTAELAAGAVTTTKLGTNEASGLCKAWVNFNGTGTVAIRASYNVSSITDNGTGDYTVNFTTALADANYVVCGSTQTNGSSSNGTGNASVTLNRIPANALTVNGARLYTRGSDDISATIDPLQVCVAVFR